MCLPACSEVVEQNLKNRREFLQALGGGIAAMGLGCARPLAKSVESPLPLNRAVTMAVDLTHTLTPTFPTYGGKEQFSLEPLATYEKNGYSGKRWTLAEHTGTHIDAPIHFSKGGLSVGEIPAKALVVSLVVVDIRAKASVNADSELTVDDLKQWEAKHGPIPPGACVAMNTGWAEKAGGPGFRNADEKGTLHFPGFHEDAVDFLLEERNINGIAVDTLSLDIGKSTTFSVHSRLLPANRWGLECVANLSAVPAAGATLIVGAPKVAEGTGGLTRLFALV